jgi:small GTP-binding protein
MDNNRLVFRLLLIGSTQVGKTCIMLRYTEGIFLPNYVRTIAVYCRSKTNMFQSKFAKIFIYDTPGTVEFSTLTPAYWHRVEKIIFVIAMLDESSFRYAKEHYENIFVQAESKAGKVVLLNKCDLKDTNLQRGNQFETDVRSWAENCQALFFMCSARDSDNIVEPIEQLANELVEKELQSDMNVKDISKNTRRKCEVF